MLTTNEPVQARDPLYPGSAVFALGSPFGLLDTSGAPTMPEAMPFGLRHAVVANVLPMGDLSAYGFDHHLQVGTVTDADGVVSPLLKHTDGATATRTNADGKGGPDSDQDVRED
jgi:putative ATP-grasp target RiPP